jgi:hypothetical protein
MKQPLSIVLDQVNGRTPGGRDFGEGRKTQWLSSALVSLMTPGLAFFDGGMVCAKSILNMALTRPNTLKPLTISLVSDRALHRAWPAPAGRHKE